MRAVLFAAAALGLAACSPSTGPGSAIRVETSEPVYPLPPIPQPVTFTVRNTGSEPLALPRCGDSVAGELRRRDGGGAWVTVASGFCATFAQLAPVLLAPGEEGHGEMAVATAGRYRISVPVARAVGEEFTSHAVSADFVVRWLED